MQRTIPLALVAITVMSLLGACSSYNQETSVTPSIVTPAVQTAASQATRAPAASAAASAVTPVQATATQTVAPGTCPDAAAPVPVSIPGIPPIPADAKAVTTPSGLQYIDIVAGTGPVAGKGQTASVQYTGWLTDGKKFDSSRDRGQPFPFPLGGGQVIKGWDEGVAGMHVGGQRRLIIPQQLAYGVKGGGGVIPPCATLIFDVELLGLR
jgi:hypothetical protein